MPPYVSALEGVALESTLQAVLAELLQKLEPGQSVVVSSVGGTVAVSGPLTDAQLRATALPVSGTVGVSNFPATQLVSGTVNVGNFPGPDESGLTDVQLRAAAVPVSGPLTDTQLRATGVPVTGPLTDAQLRALAVAISGTVTLDVATLAALETISIANFPATQPISGTVTVVEPVSIDDNSGSLTTDGTYDERYSGGKLSFATTVAAAGDTALVTPATGKALRVVWVSAIPSPDNSSANRVRFKFGAAGAPFYESYAVAHWEVFQGAVDVPLVLNTATAEAVSVTVHYREL